MKIGLKIINGIEDYIITDILPNDYTDITSVYNWIKVGSFLFYDYKFIRKRLQELSATNWNEFTEDEKIFVCKYKATSVERCKEILEEDFNYWMSDFDLKSVKCRQERFSKAKTVLISNIDTVSQYTVIGYLNLTNLITNYIEQGIEGKSSGDLIVGIYDFIESTDIFAESGLSSFNLTMLDNITKQEMIVNIMDTLKNGSYGNS